MIQTELNSLTPALKRRIRITSMRVTSARLKIKLIVHKNINDCDDNINNSRLWF